MKPAPYRSLKLAICFFTLIFLSESSHAQANLDSLWQVWKNPQKADTLRLKAIHKFAWQGYIFTAPDSAFYYAKKEYDFAKKVGREINMSDALNTMAVSHAIRGNHKEAITYYEECIAIRKKLNRKDLIGGTLTNLGSSYRELGNYAKAIDCQIRSLKLKEEDNDTLGMAHTNINISILYKEQDELELALKYQKIALKLYESVNNVVGINTAYVNIGQTYQALGDSRNALNYFNRALKFSENNNFDRGKMIVYLNLADLKDESEVEDRIEYNHKALDLARSSQELTIASKALSNLAGIHFDLGRTGLALKEAREAYAIAEKSGSLSDIKKSSSILSEILETLGMHREALEMYQIHISARDSLKSENNQKEVLRQSYKYEYEKQAIADSIQSAEEAKLKDAKLAKQRAVVQKQRQQSYFLVAGLIFAMIFIGFVYNRWRVTRKQRNIIAEQKEEVDQAYTELNVEKEKSEELLLNILPQEVADELKEKGAADAQLIDDVTVLFTDFKGFTALSEQLTAKELVHEINVCFSAFDKIMEKYNIEKIKTIGDAYMAAGGLPVPNKTHALDVVNAALEIQAFMLNLAKKKKQKGEPFFEIRIGVHTGPVVAGIVGIKKFQYDIWGDTVNTASRMESSGGVGKVNISQNTFDLVHALPQFSFESRGEIEAKGKGMLPMYFVERS
ncbi:MAG: adenylate/guanylate cyclase domain-containing protein [Fluviicola sp.]